jgi:glycosyltransferase involved in cell wall biosynthesis
MGKKASRAVDDVEQKFSLLTACSNGEEFLDSWCKSIVKQTYRPLEVSFCDDISTDRTLQKVVDVCLPQFQKVGISLIIKSNARKHKYGTSLSYTVQQSHSSFFGVFDIDDTLPHDTVESVMNVYKKHPEIGHVYTQFDVYDCEMNFKKTGFSRLPREGSNILDEGWSYGEHIYSHFRTFSKRVPDFYTVVVKGRYAIDQYMGMTLEERTPGAFLNKVCYNYRAGCENSISSKFGAQRREYWYKLMESFLDRRRRKKIKVKPIIEVFE